jgi:hypothetical protein
MLWMIRLSLTYKRWRQQIENQMSLGSRACPSWFALHYLLLTTKRIRWGGGWSIGERHVEGWLLHDIGGGDVNDTQIINYKRRKTTQPTIWSSAKKRFITLVPCTQEAYLVDSGEPIRFPKLSQVHEGVIQEPKVDLANTKGKRLNPKARLTHVTTYAHGEGVGEDLKGSTSSPSSGNPSHCHMRRTRLAQKLIWDVTKPLDY